MENFIAAIRSRLYADAATFTGPTTLCSTVLLWTLVASEASGDRRPLWLAISTLCAAGSVTKLAHRPALCIGACLQLYRIIEAFPSTANHTYLQGFLLIIGAVLALVPERAAEEQLLASYRFVAAIVLIGAGLQKVLYGAYFDGRMLAVLASKHERFSAMLAPLLAPHEMARLRRLDIHVAGSGPFSSGSLLFLIASNLACVAEIGLGALLLSRKYAAAGALLTIMFFIVIELAAREIVFGLVMISLTSLFLSPKKALVVLRITCAAAILFSLIALGVVPGAKYLVLSEMP